MVDGTVGNTVVAGAVVRSNYLPLIVAAVHVEAGRSLVIVA